MKAILHALLCAALVGLSPSAHATVIYDESVSGDAPSVAGAALVGATANIVDGANEILGSVPTTEFDDYILTIPIDGTLLSITFTSSINQPVAFFVADLYEYTPAAVLLATFTSPVLTAGVPVSAFTSALPLDAGTYRIDHRTVLQGGGFNYQWTLTASVPEPGTIALVAAGLLIPGMARKRRRT